MAYTVEYRTFRKGIENDYGWQSEPPMGADRIVNMRVNNNGSLALRRGTTNPLVSAAESSQITTLIRANRVNAASQFQHFFIVEASTTPLKRLNSAAWTEVQNKSVNPDASFTFGSRDAMYPGWIVFNGRLFLGLNSATNRNSWIDLNATTPLAYTLGHATPTTPTDALVTGGSLANGSWYGYVYTYYNPTYEIETAPSAVTTANPSGTDLTVRLTMTQTVDEQFTQVRIYRTSAQTSSALAESATKSLLTTQAMTNGTSTFTYDDDGTGTLGAANATDDHDQQTSQLRFLTEYNNALWGVVAPRTVVFCKTTSTDVFPDWYPTENTIEVGQVGSEITGIAPDPSFGGLLVFMSNGVYRITGDNVQNYRVSRVEKSIGCPYPRTVTALPGRLRFLGTDGAIWETDGSTFVSVSRRIDRYFRGVSIGTYDFMVAPALAWIPCSAYFNNAYFVTTPAQQGNHDLTSASTTVTTPGGTALFSGTTKYRIVDGTAIDLSKLKPGMWACVRDDPSRNGVIVAVTDGTDTVDVEDWRGTAPATGERFVFIEDMEQHVHELDWDYWREFRTLGSMRHMPPHAFSVWNGATDNGEFYGAPTSSSSGAVYRYEVHDATDDSGTAIETLWRTGWIQRPQGSRLSAIRVYQDSPMAFSLVRVFTDFDSSNVTASGTSLTPAESTGYALQEIDLATCVGYAFMVEFNTDSATTFAPIHRIVLEFTL